MKVGLGLEEARSVRWTLFSLEDVSDTTTSMTQVYVRASKQTQLFTYFSILNLVKYQYIPSDFL